MNVVPTRLPGVLIFEPRVFAMTAAISWKPGARRCTRPRGWMRRLSKTTSPSPSGACSVACIINTRGSNGKLIAVAEGEVFDVAVDIRRGSPTFGQWMALSFSPRTPRGHVPSGFAHGFVVTSEIGRFHKCTAPYQPRDEGSILWNDPEVRHRMAGELVAGGRCRRLAMCPRNACLVGTNFPSERDRSLSRVAAVFGGLDEESEGADADSEETGRKAHREGDFDRQQARREFPRNARRSPSWTMTMDSPARRASRWGSMVRGG